jgi:hypothetical protein
MVREALVNQWVGTKYRVVGNYYRDVEANAVYSNIRTGDIGWLKHEPTNRHDPDAVQVYASNTLFDSESIGKPIMIGYIPGGSKYTGPNLIMVRFIRSGSSNKIIEAEIIDYIDTSMERPNSLIRLNFNVDHDKVVTVYPGVGNGFVYGKSGNTYEQISFENANQLSNWLSNNGMASLDTNGNYKPIVCDVIRNHILIPRIR